MIFISIITFGCIFQKSWCALDPNLWAAMGSSTKPTPSPRCLIEGALARFEAPMLQDYSSFRPFVVGDWKKEKNSIMMMVNEAAYTFQYAENVSKTFLENSFPGWDTEYRRIIRKFQSLCDDVLDLTEQKLAQMRSESSHMKLEKTTESAKTEYLEASRHETNKDLSRKRIERGSNEESREIEVHTTIRKKMRPNFTQHELIESLKECFEAIENPQGRVPVALSWSWQLQFERAMFQVIEYLYKFDLIGPEDLSMFYKGDGKVLKVTGQHIQKSVYREAWHLPFLHKPLQTFRIMDKRVDYLQYSLNGLDESSKKSIIHTAFSECLQTLKTKYAIDENWPILNEILNFLTRDSFLAHLSKWKPHPRTHESKEILDKYVTHLIQNFLQPECFMKSGDKFGTEAYQLNVQMLKYISDNLDDQQSLKKIFGENCVEYEDFRIKLKLFLDLDNFWLFYLKEYECKSELKPQDYRIISRNQLELTLRRTKEEIGKFKNECLKGLKMIESDYNMCVWLENGFVSKHVDRFRPYLIIFQYEV